MVLHNQPTLTIPPINVGESGLHGVAITECKSVNAGVNRDIAEGADIRFIDDTLRTLR